MYRPDVPDVLPVENFIGAVTPVMTAAAEIYLNCIPALKTERLQRDLAALMDISFSTDNDVASQLRMHIDAELNRREL